MWTYKHHTKPEGVTCYTREYVLVSHRSNTTSIYVLNAKTGELVRLLTDDIVRTTTGVYDLHIYGDTLIVPRCGENKVLFYKLTDRPI